ncbi:hypothetical protein BVC80_8831g5 [Macleaya cordata]|uniref:Uncharacterized protein n=1 Tax=Macleaya cordata TaxID=56857 RepID=A0A200RE39_MACCD|nr:hypothetical protein BVC80_8831g5 [Macleaya cordata]
MENDQGDLADIVRASGGGSSSSTTGNKNNNNNQQQISTDWQFPSKPIKFPSSSAGIEEDPVDNFGDPFSSTRDPLLQELEDIATARSGFFENSNSLDPVKMNVVAEDDTSICSSLLAQRILDEEMKRPCNIFSRMLQISPNTKMPVSPIDLSASASPSGTSSSSCLIVNNDMVVNKASSSTGCSVDNSAAVVQISSPRNTGIKRR